MQAKSTTAPLTNRARVARYRAAHPERCRESYRKWYYAHRTEQKVRRVATPEETKAKRAAYRAEHRAEIAASWAAYYEAHRVELLQKQATRIRTNPEIEAAKHRRYRDGHREHVLSKNSLQRARKLSAPVVEKIIRSVVFNRDGGRCHVCGKRVDPKHWHLDHLIPLKNPYGPPGEHSYRNVAVAHPSCNLRKSNTGTAQLRLLS